MTGFRDVFGEAAAARGSAPGRVNLMGDHTDYNDGFVLPIAITQRTTVDIAAAGAGPDEAYSVARGVTLTFDATAPGLTDFPAYLGGCVKVLAEEGYAVPRLKFFIASDVPVGVGLSSSAALEVATLRALDRLLGIGLADERLAVLAWRAETEHAGVACGIMDQFACTIATTDRMLFLDTRSRRHSLMPLPADACVAVFDSGVSRSLAASAYNRRREECRDACRRLGVPALRDVTDLRAGDGLPPPLGRRVRHVVSENARVLAAREADAVTFGRLMTESHASLRDDYEVSHPALDTLVARLGEQPGVYGARMTGAGFGGACIALTKPDLAEAIAARIVAATPSARLLTIIGAPHAGGRLPSN